jgi:chaperonin GroES
MKFRPLRDNVLIRRVEAKEKTAGGLILPESAKDKPQEAEVIAIGPGRTNKEGNKVPMTVSVGDLVLFKKYSTTDVKLEGDQYLILKESDILAVVEQ